MSIQTDDSSESSRFPLTSRVKLWGELLAALTVLLAIVGMAVTSPPLVGPDEPAHQATAYYTSVNILPPEREADYYTPGIFKQGACTAFDSTKDASCALPREDSWPAKVRVLNYPPPYYWVVALGQKAMPGTDDWLDIGGRLASLLLNVGALGLLALLARRVTTSWGTYLLLISTPMAAFLWAVVNPNGWEVTSGLLFAFLFATAWWNWDVGLNRRLSGWARVLLVTAASLAFALSRHDAAVWMCLLVLTVFLMGPSPLQRSAKVRLLGAFLIGLIAAVLWQLTHPAIHEPNNDDPIKDPTGLNYLHWLGQIDEMLPERLRQMVGVLGWLDTPVPYTLAILLMLGWALLIGIMYARRHIPLGVLATGFAATILVPTALELLRWNDWPFWYQGRITLSFTLPFLFLLLLRFADSSSRAAIALSLITSLALAFMVWQNLMRYAFGTKDYIPLRWTDPATGGFWFWIGTLVVVAIVLVTIARAWLLVLGYRRRSIAP